MNEKNECLFIIFYFKQNRSKTPQKAKNEPLPNVFVPRMPAEQEPPQVTSIRTDTFEQPKQQHQTSYQANQPPPQLSTPPISPALHRKEREPKRQSSQQQIIHSPFPNQQQPPQTPTHQNTQSYQQPYTPTHQNTQQPFVPQTPTNSESSFLSFERKF